MELCGFQGFCNRLKGHTGAHTASPTRATMAHDRVRTPEALEVLERLDFPAPEVVYPFTETQRAIVYHEGGAEEVYGTAYEDAEAMDAMLSCHRDHPDARVEVVDAEKHYAEREDYLGEL